MRVKYGLSQVKSSDKFDFVLLAYLVVMAITSFFAIFSAFGVIGPEAGMNYLTKQIVWFSVGFIALAFIMYLGNDSIFQFAKIAYWILMGCLIYLFLSRLLYTFVGGRTLPLTDDVNGAISWFFLPGFSFQPSEFMKIVLIIITAQVIDDHNKNQLINSFEMDFQLFLNIAKWALPPMILILLQPDTGVVFIIAISLLAMVLCSGINKEWIWLIVAIIVGAIGIFAYLYTFHFQFLHDLLGYKIDRITSLLDPESNMKNEGFQQYLSLLIIGSSGLKGYGLQQFITYFPEAQTDLIFVVIAQTWGLMGTMFIVLLCIGLDFHLCKIASRTKSMFEKYIILGVLGMTLYQQVQNIGMLVGLLPITGITLPLISYGGSSLLSYLAAFGIIMNTSSKRNDTPELS